MKLSDALAIRDDLTAKGAAIDAWYAGLSPDLLAMLDAPADRVHGLLSELLALELVEETNADAFDAAVAVAVQYALKHDHDAEAFFIAAARFIRKAGA
jgi:hypothetical protein